MLSKGNIGIIGEAVNSYRKAENAELSHSKEIIAFRNRLIHAYNSLEDEIIWAILKKHLPELKKEIAGLLHYNLDDGIVLANNSFTKSAIELAQSNGIELVHYLDIQKI